MIKTYYMLTKPGIILGNLITTAGGFALASKGHPDWRLFLIAMVGLSLVIASSCVVNNYMDRVSDAKMARTKHRALAKGLISVKSALIFAVLLGLSGTIVLGVWINLLTMLAALFGFFAYVVVYGVCKYRTSYGTLIGSIAGGVPPVVGYCAASNALDMGTLVLFMIIVLWQMPHFFAIALYRYDDYAAASIPVLPVAKGAQVTKIQMLLYMIAFVATTLLLTFFGYTGYLYLTVAAVLGSIWLWLCIQGFKRTDNERWARGIFRFSLVIITALCVTIPFDS